LFDGQPENTAFSDILSVTASPPRITLARALSAWWRDNLHQRGFFRTAVYFLQEMRDFVRDSTPSRHRQRYGDIDYDWEHRVDTTEATVSFRNRLLGVFHSAYQPTQPEVFREMIGGLGIDYSEFTFIDLGSGKGRTLLMASDYPFRQVLGVELLPELHQIAVENISKYNGGVAARVHSICGDARFFEFPGAPTVLFLFNPFPQPVLQAVLGRLMHSLQKHPRVVYVIYHNPVLEPVLASITGMKVFRRADQYAIFVTGL
jgi:SAM-dependent methyltransferase